MPPRLQISSSRRQLDVKTEKVKLLKSQLLAFEKTKRRLIVYPQLTHLDISNLLSCRETRRWLQSVKNFYNATVLRKTARSRSNRSCLRSRTTARSSESFCFSCQRLIISMLNYSGACFAFVLKTKYLSGSSLNIRKRARCFQIDRKDDGVSRRSWVRHMIR